MSKSARAMISWIPASKGGRRKPPVTPYVSIARFENDAGWPEAIWSLKVDRLKRYQGNRFWFAEVSLPAPTAPTHLLRKGERFQIYEGPKIVAHGIVAGVKAQAPADKTKIAAVLPL